MNNNPEKVITEIKNGNEQVLTKIYKKVYRYIETYSRSIGINNAECEEAVQDAFEVFYRQIISSKLKLTCTVDTYIISIAKRLLMVNQRKRLKIEIDELNEPDELIDEDELTAVKIKEKKHQIFIEEFKKLGKDCKSVLTYTLKGQSVKEITVRMNYSSEKFTKTKRARCRKYLIEKIKANPWYEKLTGSTTEDFELYIWGDDQVSKTNVRRRTKKR